MSKVGIRLSIDVSKIEKERLHKGEKGTYLDATVFVDLTNADQYGNNGMITQSVSKEEKESGVQGAILGNCKVFWQDGSAQPRQVSARQAHSAPQQGPGFDNFDDDIPFN